MGAQPVPPSDVTTVAGEMRTGGGRRTLGRVSP